MLIPGGTGFLGSAVTEVLVARGDEVVVLTRGSDKARGPVSFVHWDGRTEGPWVDGLGDIHAVVHLSGKRVDCLPTKSNIRKLISSRVEPVLAVGEAVASGKITPEVWVQISSLAIFGEGGEAVIDESTTPSGVGPPQMVQVCLAWESAVGVATATVDRTMILRGGIGLGGTGDPATARLLFLARLGLGGRIASGKQWVSWISLDDFVNVILRSIDDDTMSGVYHATSPNPVRNAEMMSTYRNLAGRKWGIPSPRFVTKIGALALGSDPALALTGRRVVPRRLLEAGYEFEHPDFADAAALAVGAVPK